MIGSLTNNLLTVGYQRSNGIKLQSIDDDFRSNERKHNIEVKATNYEVISKKKNEQEMKMN